MAYPLLRDACRQLFLLLGWLLLPYTLMAQAWLEPANAQETQIIKILFNPANTPLASHTEVYVHHGVVLAGPTDTTPWEKVKTTWGNNTQGKMTKRADGYWEFTISPSARQYFGLEATQRAYRLAMVFRSADGNTQSSNIYLDLGTALNPHAATVAQAPTLTFYTAGTPLAGKDKVYLHAGIVTDRPDGTTWTHTVGNWGQDDGVGQMTKVSADCWEITLGASLQQYFGLAASDAAYRIALVLRSADGSAVYKNGSSDFFLDLDPGFQLYLDQPRQQQLMLTVGASLQVSLRTTQTAGQLKLVYDGQTVTADNASALDRSISFPNAGDYTVQATATKGSDTRTQSFQVYVTSPSPTVTLPTGMKDGVNYDSSDPTKATLVLYAPGKSYVYLFGEMSNWKVQPSYLMNRDGDRFWITLTGLESGHRYQYQYYMYTGERHRGVCDPYAEEVVTEYDHYISTANLGTASLAYPAGKTSGNVAVLQTNRPAYVWKNPTFDRPDKDKLVVYELLIRDFDARENYQAVIEKFDYLKGLGINAIELMPVTEFNGNDSWGYNPTSYFSPEKAYGTSEMLKEFIDKCHGQGFAVILDMVYNHAHEDCPLVGMYFDWSTYKPLNNPWVNTEAKHPYNVFHDFNHEAAYTKQYFDRVNEFWLREYKIDGFRFDLTKGFTQNYTTSLDAWTAYDQSRVNLIKRMLTAIKGVDANAYMILEHLGEEGEEKQYRDEGALLWANASHHMGELMKGNNINAGWVVEDYINRGRLAYMESHDEERIMAATLQYGAEQGSYSLKQLQQALEKEKGLAALYLLSPGPKMIWQFGELGYEVPINDGGRTGRKPIRWEYASDPDRSKLYKVYGELNRLRAAYPMFTENMVWQTLNDANAVVKRISYKKNAVEAHLLVNTGVTPATYILPVSTTGTYYDHFGGRTRDISAGDYTLTLAAGQFVLLSNQSLGTVALGLVNERVRLERSSELEDQPAKLVFDARGTVLAGQPKIYAHRGVLLAENSTTWQHIIGTWGSDNGVGLMTAKAGATDIWELDITPSLRSHFSVLDNERIHRLAALVRSSGTQAVRTPFGTDFEFSVTPLPPAKNLPLLLAHWQGRVSAGQAQLWWEFSNGALVSHCEVERSADGVSYMSVWKGQGLQYAEPLSVQGAFYRLRVQQLDGTLLYSKPVFLVAGGHQPALSILSNPSSGRISFRYLGQPYAQVQVQLFDLSGRLHSEQPMRLGADGRLQHTVTPLSAGVYVLRVQDGGSMAVGRALVE